MIIFPHHSARNRLTKIVQDSLEASIRQLAEKFLLFYGTKKFVTVFTRTIIMGDPCHHGIVRLQFANRRQDSRYEPVVVSNKQLLTADKGWYFSFRTAAGCLTSKASTLRNFANSLKYYSRRLMKLLGREFNHKTKYVLATLLISISHCSAPTLFNRQMQLSRFCYINCSL